MNMNNLAAVESGAARTFHSHIRRPLVALAALALAAIGILQTAQAQSTWPTRPVRVVIMVAAGGGADNVGRFIADRLTGRLGQAVVVENKTGAGGNIGTEF